MAMIIFFKTRIISLKLNYKITKLSLFSKENLPTDA